jgi:subtilisin family serine protease
MKTRISKQSRSFAILFSLLLMAVFAPGLQSSALASVVFLPVINRVQESQTAQEEVIVKLDVLQPGATIEAINQTYGTTTIRALAPGRAVYLLQAPAGADPVQLVADMGNDPRILYAELNRATDAPEAIGRSGFAWGGYDPTPYDTQYPQQMLGLPAAHAISQGAGVVVAVIDTGVQLTHPELAGRLTTARIDFVDGDNVPEDEFSGGTDYGAGHGTHVAGIIHLVAPQAQIMPIRVLDTDGRGYSFVIGEAILYALENGADVINLSLGMPESASYYLEDIVEEATQQGVVVVAAAGNLNSTQKQFPAATECALGVTAIDPNRVKADFASFGGWVSLAAPGVGIHSTLPVDGYGSWSGTSMAAPFAAGQAALLLSLDPDLDVVQVADLMGGSAVNINPVNPGYTNQLGAGQIDVIASLQALQAGNIPDLGLLDDDCSEGDDAVVTLRDLIIISQLWGLPAGPPHDGDGDGIITISDIQSVARQWGLSVP